MPVGLCETAACQERPLLTVPEAAEPSANSRLA